MSVVRRLSQETLEKTLARAPKSSQVITANRLLDGRVVFLAPHGWDADVAVADVHADPLAAEDAMRKAQNSAEAGEVVEPYAIAVTTIDGHVMPTLLRERIRADGPTIQAGLDAA